MVTIDWGDNSPLETINGQHNFTIEHQYPDDDGDDNYTISVTITNNFGVKITETIDLSVKNQPPILTVIGNQEINEGETLILDPIATFSDPGFGINETWTYSIDWGDNSNLDQGIPVITQVGSPQVDTEGKISGNHTYGDDGQYIVTLNIKDDDSGEDIQSLNITVNNVSPTLDSIPNTIINEGDLL